MPPDPVNDIFWVPVSSSWETAKESSLLVLLPRDEAAMYHDLYFQNDFVSRYAERYFQTEALQRRFESRFQNPTTATQATGEALGPMGPEDLKQYSGLIADSIDSLAECRFLADLANSGATAVLNGAQSSDEVEQAVAKTQHLNNAPTPVSTPASR